MTRARLVPTIALLLGSLAGTSCALGGERGDAAVSEVDAGSDAGIRSEDAGRCVPPGFTGRSVVYAHGPAVPLDATHPTQEFLAVIDPHARAIVDYILLDCPGLSGGILDLAVDAQGMVMLSGGGTFTRFDPETRTCTLVRGPIVHNQGTDAEWWETVQTPNNLTFVPPGVLHPTREVMAAIGFHYIDEPRRLYEPGFMRYDPATGREEVLYEWSTDSGLEISGDLVVVTDSCTHEPHAFITVTGPRARTHCHRCEEGEVAGVDCGNCLYELDVRSGELMREVALIPAQSVFGLALFGDTLFGFSYGDYFRGVNGRIFAIEPTGEDAAITEIPVVPPTGYRSMHWNGAGSTTLAPFLI